MDRIEYEIFGRDVPIYATNSSLYPYLKYEKAILLLESFLTLYIVYAEFVEPESLFIIFLFMLFMWNLPVTTILKDTFEIVVLLFEIDADRIDGIERKNVVDIHERNSVSQIAPTQIYNLYRMGRISKSYCHHRSTILDLYYKGYLLKKDIQYIDANMLPSIAKVVKEVARRKLTKADIVKYKAGYTTLDELYNIARNVSPNYISQRDDVAGILDEGVWLPPLLSNEIRETFDDSELSKGISKRMTYVNHNWCLYLMVLVGLILLLVFEPFTFTAEIPTLLYRLSSSGIEVYADREDQIERPSAPINIDERKSFRQMIEKNEIDVETFNMYRTGRISYEYALQRHMKNDLASRGYISSLDETVSDYHEQIVNDVLNGHLSRMDYIEFQRNLLSINELKQKALQSRIDTNDFKCHDGLINEEVLKNSYSAV